jgi:hypothetical protein
MCTASYRTYIYKNIYVYICKYTLYFFFFSTREEWNRERLILFFTHTQGGKRKKNKNKNKLSPLFDESIFPHSSNACTHKHT